jgi:CheY-like chemotaxis protein
VGPARQAAREAPLAISGKMGLVRRALRRTRAILAGRVPRVLIIEDDGEIRDVLAQVLENDGFEVAVAANGLEGLARARRFRPHVILLDLMMPIMDGWQFRAEQKLDPQIATIPVVVVSAHGRRPDLDVQGFIPKPCDVEEVVDAARRHAASRPHAPTPPAW